MSPAEASIRKFIAEWRKMRGLHPDDVTALHAGDDDREAVLRISDMAALLSELDALRDVLRRNGFVPCDIAACNCGSWHARYGLPQRMEEIQQALADAGHPRSNENGNLTLNALAQLVAERDALRAAASDGPVYKQLYAEAEAENAALRARCGAADALLRTVSQWRPRRPENIFAAIDAAMSHEKRKQALDDMASNADELGLDF